MIIGKHYCNHEEACISGGIGCGVVYLGGCNMHCVYCLVHEVSQDREGIEYTPQEAAQLLLRMEQRGVSHISIANVEPSADEVIKAIAIARREGLSVPLLNNFNGYATEEQMQRLMPVFDGYVMDFKYADSAFGKRLSGVPDYTASALQNLRLLSEHYGENRYDANGLLLRGVLLRHLVLPGLFQGVKDTISLIAQNNPNHYPLDLMNNFVPEYRTTEYLPGPYVLGGAVYARCITMAKSLGLTIIE